VPFRARVAPGPPGASALPARDITIANVRCRGLHVACAKRDHPESALRGAAQMRELLFCLHTALAALFLIGGVALAIESWFGGWGLGLILALATVNGVAFVILAMLFAATAIHLRRSGLM